jgi:hypothetical protein
MAVRLTPEAVRDQHEWVRERAPRLTALVDDTRRFLADAFDAEVGSVDVGQVRAEVDAVFADGDRGLNVAGYVLLLRELDVEDDYPGFVVDERLGRLLAATVAGGDPLGLLAEATFHVADVRTHGGGTAGLDDLDAALAAGLHTRLPGWPWREGP